MYMLWRFLQNQMQCIVACFLTITRAIAAEAARQRRKFVLRSLLEASEIDKQELYEYVPANIYMRNDDCGKLPILIAVCNDASKR
jgi:hypothetical protein